MDTGLFPHNTMESMEEHRTPSTSSSDDDDDDDTHYKRKLLYRRLKVIIIGLLALCLLLLGCLLGLVLPATLESPKTHFVSEGFRETPSAKIGDLHDDIVHFIDMNSPDLNQSEMHIRGIWFPFRYELEDVETTPTAAIPTETTSTAATPTVAISTAATLTTATPTAATLTTATSTAAIPTAVILTQDNATTDEEAAIPKFWIVHWKNHLENEIQKTSNSSEEQQWSSPAPTQMSQSNVRQVTSYPPRNSSTTATSVGIGRKPNTTVEEPFGAEMSS